MLQVRYMKNLGKKNCEAASLVHSILGKFLSDEVAIKFNVQGTLRKKTDAMGQPAEKKRALKNTLLYKALMGKFLTTK